VTLPPLLAKAALSLLQSAAAEHCCVFVSLDTEQHSAQARLAAGTARAVNN
jgi:hypothetical protein